MDTLIELIVVIFEIDPGLGVVFILASIGFLSTTVLLVVKVVGWTRGAVRQSHTWLRDSGRLTRPDAATPALPADPPALVNLLLTRREDQPRRRSVLIVYIVAIIAVGSQRRVWLSDPGRAALARWLGVREWLRAHEVFEDLLASSVVVWGRTSRTAARWASRGPRNSPA